jgi:hypothetical protein
VIVPVYLPKRPRTFETTMWRTEKLMPVWAASIFQLLLFMGLPSAVSGDGAATEAPVTLRRDA